MTPSASAGMAPQGAGPGRQQPDPLGHAEASARRRFPTLLGSRWRWRAGRQVAALFLAALAAALVALPPPVLGEETGEDDPDRQEGESRTGRVENPDQCKRGTADANYRRRLREWRTPRDLPPHRWIRGFREVTFRNVKTNRSAKLLLFDDNGEVTDEARAAIRRIWNDSGQGEGREIRDRLIKILYFVAVKFNVKEIVIVSGFRDDRDESTTNPHWQGRAADIIVPGVSSRRVWEYVQTFGRVGVGRYPVSGFVHVDVRQVSFFWEDPSGPGQPSCYYQVDRHLARRYDREYNPRRDDPRRLRGYHNWKEQQAKRRRRAGD